MNQQVCDPNRLSSFVRGELSADAERELTAHLDQCESCGKALEHQVAEASAWREAKEFLGDCDFQDQDADFSGSDTIESQVQQVLSQLLPTDDPDSLGRIGGCEVTGVIGSGGMGVVLKARDHSLDRVVAVKVMAPHLAASGSARQRFAREAKAAAAVLHPNVIAIHGVSNEQALPYLVMPYVRGETLQKRIDSQGPLSLKDTLRIGVQIAAGLAAAHEQGLVHRDIKPANILLEEGVERVTITDFGLARAVDDASLTCSGVIAGTPQYMSPEQTRGEPIDARSDLFSLGSVLYAMCAGRSPFRAETTYGVLHRIANDNPTPVCEVNSDVPDWLGPVINRLMAKRPDDRFESAAQVAELLEVCLAHVQQPTAVALPTSLTTRGSFPFLIRQPIPTGVFVMVCIFSSILLAMLMMQTGEEDAPKARDNASKDNHTAVEANTTKGARSRLNARSVVESYVASALAGDIAKAASLAKSTPADPKRIAEWRDMLNVRRLRIKTVYVNDLTNPTEALATSEAATLEKEYQQPDGQRDGFLVFTLERTDEGWFVSDIDFESEEGADDELNRFIKSNPNSIGLPPNVDADASQPIEHDVRNADADNATLTHPRKQTIGQRSSPADENAKIIVDVYGGDRVLGQKKAKYATMVQALNVIDDVQVNFREAGPGSDIALVIVRDPTCLMNQEALTIGKPSARREAITQALAHVLTVRWEDGPSTEAEEAVAEQAEIVPEIVDVDRATNAVNRAMQYLLAVQKNDSETINSIARGLAKHEQREKDIATLLSGGGIPKLYKTWIVNNSAVVAIGPVSSSDKHMNGRFLLFTLSLVDERWSIVDIDLELEESLLKRFKHPLP
jgi:serine/threonine-protein kinase